MAHHRTAALALALALAVGLPAAAAAQQPGSPAPTSPCSEVCSGGGYPTAPTTTCPAYSLPTILNHLRNPPPCSDMCSGGGSGSASPPPKTPDNCSAYHPAKIPPTAAHVITEGAGFHWGDAGIGAGAMLAVIVAVIGLGPPLTVTRRYSQHSRHDRPWTLPSPHPGPTVADDDLDIIGPPDHRPTRHTRPQ